MGSVLYQQVLEGYAERRYYEGQQLVDRLEPLAIERARVVRGRACERAAVLGLARQPRRLPRLLSLGTR